MPGYNQPYIDLYGEIHNPGESEEEKKILEEMKLCFSPMTRNEMTNFFKEKLKRLKWDLTLIMREK